MSSGSEVTWRTASLLGLAVFGLLLPAGWLSLPLAQTVAGLAILLLGFGAFSLAWELRLALGDGCLLLLGTAFVFVAVLDLLPLFTYPIFGLSPAYDAGLADRTRAAALLLQGGSFVAAPLFASRPVPALRLVLAYALASSGLAAAALSGIVPALPELAAGVDPLKLAGQAAFGALLALALPVFLWRRSAFERGVFRLILSSMAALLVSEAVLAAVILSGASSILLTALAQSARVVAFWLVYRAMVRAGLDRPAGPQARRLMDSEEKYRSLMDFAGDAIVLADERGRIVEANRRAEQLLGYNVQELQELSIEQIHPQSERLRVMGAFHTIDRQGVGSLADTTVLTKDGRIVPVDISGAAIFYGGKKVIQEILRDVTDRKKSEERLRFLSTRDTLTGLYNRALYDVEFTRLERGRSFPVSIVVADIDALKEVNLKQGNVAGDRLLRQAAQIFRESFRAEDIVARTGGDEFAALLPLSDMAAAAACLQRVRARVAAYSAAHAKAPLSLSLGMGTARTAAEMAQAVREADEDMAEDKRVRFALRQAAAYEDAAAGVEGAAESAPPSGD